MFVKVSADSSITLEDRDNFRAFKLVITGNASKLDTVRKTLAGVVELPDEKTAWISEAALRRWEGVAQDQAWQQSLSAMIEKAKPHGWIDEQRKAIKAHIEWQE
ncbi:MAG TPA: hypothetical protein VD863_05240 [Bradyrhizobium sp.]|nr:hypothetical protein [Bradyrhizobium sp.]